MKKLILAASAIALIPAAAQAQLLGGGGGLGGGIGGGIGGTLGGTIERTTTTVRGPVDSTVSGRGSTRGSQSVDARKGTVQAERSAEGSITGSTASLADAGERQRLGQRSGQRQCAIDRHRCRDRHPRAGGGHRQVVRRGHRR